MKFPSPLRTPVGAAFLSALFPGLGQAAAGERRRAAIVAIPALTTLGVFGLILLFDRHELFGLALNQSWLTSLLILDVVALIYHLWAVVDSYLVARKGPDDQPRRRRQIPAASTGKWAATFGIVMIVSGTVAVHAVVASTDMNWQHALYCLNAPTPCWVTDNPLAAASIPDANATIPDLTDTSSPNASGSVAPTASVGPVTTFDLSKLPTYPSTSNAQNWAADGQLNVLIVGIGVQNDQAGLGPDTTMVAHVDIKTGKTALIGIARNNTCWPLPQGVAEHYATSVNGCPPYTWPWPMLVRSLPNEALAHCQNFPIYPETCGQPGDPNRYLRAFVAYEQAIGTLTGLTIDGSIWMNPVGLSTVIDSLGGIDINVPSRVYDKPCGPVGSWQNKIGSTIAVPGTAVCDAHNGYSVPTGLAGVQRMKDEAATSGGKQSVVWQQGQDIAIIIQPGQQHMNGDWALAYSRSRIYSTDFARMARQQAVLKAMRTTFEPCKIVGNIPSLLSAVSTIPYAFNTDLPLTGADVQAWAGLAQHVLGGDVKSLVMDPTTLGQPFLKGYPAFDAASVAKLQDMVKHSLDSVPAATGSGGTALSC
jgi:anionic cell wall polymer biosynthesis LytR-Cps2A-Psr (LCP) family protein